MTAGQKIKIFLLTGIVYSGELISEDANFLKILDKFGAEVTFNKTAIRNWELIRNANF